MNKPSILIVDDEVDIQKTFQAILKANYVVKATGSGKDALAQLQKDRYELILLDIRMPGMDGIVTLQEIKKLDPDQAVIMVSASKDLKSAIEAMKLGAYDYVPKPFEVDDLLLTIDKALEKRRLVKENQFLRQEVEALTHEEFIGRSPALQKVFNFIKKVAPTDSTVLISGESGTGKELVARALHRQSRRSDKPFVAINCAAIPDNLLESELFGHEKGAFTGAAERKLGKFELANEGTIFLDEMGELPFPMQGKLLRVLEESTIDRVGGTFPIPIDVRIVAATNVNLPQMVEDKKFRQDLYYRLNIVPIEMPGLKERREDIEPLANYFLDEFNKKLHRKISTFAPAALALLRTYDWPGNVRELRNLVERVVVLCERDEIAAEDLPQNIIPATQVKVVPLKEALKNMEKDTIRRAIATSCGNQSKAAELLGIHRTTLLSKIEELGLK